MCVCVCVCVCVCDVFPCCCSLLFSQSSITCCVERFGDCHMTMPKCVHVFFVQGKMGSPGFPGINGIPVSIPNYFHCCSFGLCDCQTN